MLGGEPSCYSDEHSSSAAQGVALAEGYQEHGSASPGESVKGHALYGAPRAGSVMGMIASGLHGSHGSNTPPCGFSAHGYALLTSSPSLCAVLCSDAVTIQMHTGMCR